MKTTETAPDLSKRIKGPPSAPQAVRAGLHWRTKAAPLGIPLISVAFGADDRGKIRVAKGFIAIGQFAVGGICIAQFGLGVISFGQVALGIAVAGQLAIGLLTAFGQMAVATFAVGQLVVGVFARGQYGWAEYLWSPGRTDMEAVAMFEAIRWLFQQDILTILDELWFTTKNTLLGLYYTFR